MAAAAGDDFRDDAADFATLVVLGGDALGEADGDAFRERTRVVSFASTAVVADSTSLDCVVADSWPESERVFDGAVCARNAARKEAGEGRSVRGSDDDGNDDGNVEEEEEEEEEEGDDDGVMKTGSSDEPPPPPSNDDVLSAGGRGNAFDE
jgi:hypothetical protein